MCAGIAGGIIAALPMRALTPDGPGGLRLGLIIAAVVIGSLSTAFILFKCRSPDDEDEDSLMPLSASQRRQKRRARMVRAVLKAVVSAVLGAYFLVHATNQWWHTSGTVRSLQAAALLDPTHPLPECSTTCLALVLGAVGLLVLGLMVQLCALCRAKHARHSELGELSEPMAPPRDSAAAATAARGPGCQSELARRMRFKYCGGRAATNVPTHTATSVVSASSFERAGVLPAGTEARPRSARSGASSGASSGGGGGRASGGAPSAQLCGPSWERGAVGSDPWAAMGVPQACAAAEPPSTSSAPPLQPQPGPAGAQWPPANPVWPPRDEDGT